MTAKIDFSFGSLSFSGEGTEAWLATQLDKLIAAAPTLSHLKGPKASAEEDTPSDGDAESQFTESLAAHLKAKGGEAKQVVRFLATADWLRRRGAKHLSTSMITKALSDNHQKRLSNPADCLNKNIGKGFCERNKDGFFITPSGLEALGYQ